MIKISVIIPTYNNTGVLEYFFKQLTKQTYKNVEYIVSDGGSSDSTTSIAKSYGALVVNNPQRLADPGVRIGMQNASGDLLIVMAVDNFFYDIHSFEKIVEIFKDKRIYAAFPKQDSLKEDNVYTKYRNTFSDPISHFMYGHATNGRTFGRYYKTKYKNNSFVVYDYKSQPVYPLIAFAQGFIIRKRIINDKDVFDDIKPVHDMIDKGRDIAYIFSVSLVHRTYKNRLDFAKKIRWPTRNLLEKRDMGLNIRYQYFPLKVKIKMYLWPFYSLSIAFPFMVSVYGLITEKESMWLFHPIICFVAGVATIQEVLLFTIKKLGLNKIKMFVV